MSTGLGRGGMIRSLVSGMMAMIAAASLPSMNSAIEIKPSPEMGSTARITPAKLPGMSPRDFARYKSSCGRAKRKKNRLGFAKAAKFKRRRGCS